MSEGTSEACYICGRALKRYDLEPGQEQPDDLYTRDHVPPDGLFPKPKPNDLITVPCCRQCNNDCSDFDEQLRIVASMLFDSNSVGRSIFHEKVLEGTMRKQRQFQFLSDILDSMSSKTPDSKMIKFQVDRKVFELGIIRITKGLLKHLHPNFNYFNSAFEVQEIRQQWCEHQLKLMAMLKRSQMCERGNGVFRCWHYLDEAAEAGAWMLVFYDSCGFFVFHSNHPDRHPMWKNANENSPTPPSHSR